MPATDTAEGTAPSPGLRSSETVLSHPHPSWPAGFAANPRSAVRSECLRRTVRSSGFPLSRAGPRQCLSLRLFLLTELQIVEAAVLPVLGQQRVMGATLHDAPVIQD